MLRARLYLLGLFLLFGLPIVVAGWLAANHRGPGSATTNAGRLLETRAPLLDAGLVAADGVPLAPGALEGAWTLVHVIPGRCDERCRGALHLMRQVHAALGKDAGRLRRLLVFRGAWAETGWREIAAEYPQVTVARADPAWLAPIDATVREPGARIVIVDPRRYAVLSFDLDQDGRGLLRDLKRLLKLSKIG